MATGRAPWFSHLHYPAVMTLTFTLFAIMRSQGVPLVLSTYVPVLLAAGIVTALELKFPYRPDWRPPAAEVKTDLGFMTAVQLAFPPLVGFLFTYALIAPARALNLPLAQLWPHAWPIWLQAVLMILVRGRIARPHPASIREHTSCGTGTRTPTSGTRIRRPTIRRSRRDRAGW